MIKLLEDYSDKISPMKPEYCLAILTTVEMLIILVTLIWYFGKMKTKNLQLD